MELNPQKLVENAVQNSGGIGDWIKGALSAPLNVIGGAAKGVFGSLMTGLGISAGIALVKRFMPQIWFAGAHAVGGDKLVQSELAKLEKGTPTLLVDSLVQGLAVGGGLGAVTGGFNGLANGFGQGGEKNHAANFGTLLGGTVAIAAISAVALGAIHKNGLPTSISAPGKPGGAGRG